ncbi:MAG: YcxB family protein [Lachnospiraceae bacterium]|nr:YcxB family protein [Lachnospiraceae bacterium]
MIRYEFDVKMKTEDMFAFMLRQQYGGIRGIAFLFVDFALILNLVWKWGSLSTATKLIMLIVVILLTVIEPMQLYLKAHGQVKYSERLKASNHYVLDKDGITISQGEQSLGFKWGHLYKYVNTAKRVFVYTSRASAFVIPKNALGDEALDYLILMLREHKDMFLSLGSDTIEVNGVKAGELEKAAEDAQKGGEEADE